MCAVFTSICVRGVQPVLNGFATSSRFSSGCGRRYLISKPICNTVPLLVSSCAACVEHGGLLPDHPLGCKRSDVLKKPVSTVLRSLRRSTSMILCDWTFVATLPSRSVRMCVAACNSVDTPIVGKVLKLGGEYKKLGGQAT